MIYGIYHNPGSILVKFPWEENHDIIVRCHNNVVVFSHIATKHTRSSLVRPSYGGVFFWIQSQDYVYSIKEYKLLDEM